MHAHAHSYIHTFQVADAYIHSYIHTFQVVAVLGESLLVSVQDQSPQTEAAQVILLFLYIYIYIYIYICMYMYTHNVVALSVCKTRVHRQRERR